MAGVAQLVRASDCDSEGRRFDLGHSPHTKLRFLTSELFYKTFIFYVSSTL